VEEKDKNMNILNSDRHDEKTELCDHIVEFDLQWAKKDCPEEMSTTLRIEGWTGINEKRLDRILGNLHKFFRVLSASTQDGGTGTDLHSYMR
jgi:hypothetical protein